MPLLKSIAGARGTVGGQVGQGLTPIDVVRMTAAFGKQVILPTSQPLVVIGRDARPSGVMISQLVAATLQSLGIDVIDLGLSTTPTVASSQRAIIQRNGMHSSYSISRGNT
jgi:phosphomannomutase